MKITDVGTTTWPMNDPQHRLAFGDPDPKYSRGKNRTFAAFEHGIHRRVI